MALYYYLKDEVGPQPVAQPLNFRNAFRLVSIFFLSFGIGLLSWLAWPFLEWRVIYVPRFSATEIIRPIPLVVKQEAQAKNKLASVDTVPIKDWFPQAPPQSIAGSSVKNYTLSIPKLKIADAQVIVGAEDLDKSLIHYGGTALPGENGTAIIFGHSILPQFYNPKSYRAIFSTIHTLEEGDEISAEIDGIKYRYRIFGSEIVDPSNVSLFLEQRTDNSYLYLITCTPPGTYWKRLVVKAKLVNL